ncbi:MAG TPA: carotenoid biosynthesis protein [Candidatus Methylomirabilis sp.]|nr:carotenoid biosynthesis protein [Candidatus Methylomirabilis sp.]
MNRITVRSAATGLLAVLLIASALMILFGRWGNMYFYGATLTALLLGIVQLDAWRAAYGWLRSLGAYVTIFALATIAIGASMYLGWPLGRFQFTGLLGWELLGLVPWTVPVVWSFILAVSLALTRPMSLPAGARERYAEIFSWSFDAALFATLLDAVIEPVATRAGLKIYAQQVGFQGVPFQHFLGWFVTSFLLAAVVLAWTGALPLKAEVARHLSVSAALLILFWIALSITSAIPLATALGVVLILMIAWKQRRIERDVTRVQV